MKTSSGGYPSCGYLSRGFLSVRNVASARLAMLLLGSLGLAMVAGCGGGTQVAETDPGKARIVVSDVGPAASDPNRERFKKFFTADAFAAADAQRAEFGKYDLYVPKDGASISGDTATLTVEVKSLDGTRDFGTVEWTAQKVDGSWKLVDFPFPSG